MMNGMEDEWMDGGWIGRYKLMNGWIDGQMDKWSKHVQVDGWLNG